MRVPAIRDELIFADAVAWRRWLDAHHATHSEAWVVVTKKGAKAPTRLTFDSALEEAICYGWIDNKGDGT